VVDRIQAARTDGTDGIVLNPGERGNRDFRRRARLADQQAVGHTTRWLSEMRSSASPSLSSR
jgi:hypothetical protein